jgi:hypothetical protein
MSTEHQPAIEETRYFLTELTDLALEDERPLNEISTEAGLSGCVLSDWKMGRCRDVKLSSALAIADVLGYEFDLHKKD